jgi:hypothetical protein
MTDCIKEWLYIKEPLNTVEGETIDISGSASHADGASPVPHEIIFHMRFYFRPWDCFSQGWYCV